MNKARVAAIICTLAVSGAVAQSPCNVTQVYSDTRRAERTGDAVDRMHPLVSRSRYFPLVEAGKWADAMTLVGSDAAMAFAAANVPSAERDEFMAQVAEAVKALSNLPTDATRATYIANTVKATRFKSGLDAGGTNFLLFAGANTIIMPLGAAGPREKALCWAALSADLVLFRLVQPLEADAIKRLGSITTSWKNFREYGYSRQPLELWLQRGTLADTLPRKWQFIVAHLSGGGEISGWGQRIDSLSANQTAVIEGLGLLKYFNDWRWYGGTSVVLALADGRRLGIGPMFHFGPGLRGGAIVRNEGGAKWSALMSVDLFGLFERSKKPVDDGWNVAKSVIALPKP